MELAKFCADHVPRKGIATIDRSLFARAKTLDLEIGAGVGWHAIRYAQQNPQRLLIALEHGQSRFEKFSRRLGRHSEVQNLLAWKVDAIPFLTYCLQSCSLDRVMILYPNPYPKKSQANKRFHRMPFFEVIRDRLKVGGELELRSNEERYFEEARQWISEFWGLKISHLETIARPRNPEFEPETHFEKKYFERGERLFCGRFIKDR